MQRINNIPSGATPQPTRPIAIINPLTTVGPARSPVIARPAIQGVRPTLPPVTPTAPIARPITTPVLAGGRTPIPVQVPRVPQPAIPQPAIPQVAVPIARAPLSPVVVARPPVPISVARPPLSPVVVARPPVSPVSGLRVTVSPVAPVPAPAMPPTLIKRAVVRSYNQAVAMPQQITERPLGEWQLDWFARIRQILSLNYGYIDTSQPGSGKTSVTLWIAKIFNLPVLVIAPAGIVDAGVWRREAQRVNAQHLIIDVVSYNTLAGKKFKQPSHPYLSSLDRLTEGGVVQTRFDATEYYKSITGRGCLLVFDEFSNLKNTSRKLKASLEMLANVITEGGPSRYALLSGTPFDKEGHAVNILRALRYIRAPRLYYKDPSTKEVTLEGLQELIEACRLMDEATTSRVVSEYNIDSMNTEISQSLVYELYTNVIKQAISGSMISPPTEGRFDQYNGFFNINALDLVQLQRGVADLATAVRFDPRTGQIGSNKSAFTKVTPALRMIESAKINDMIRVAREYLQQYPRLKVILAVNFTETVDDLMAGLADYGTIQFDGRTKKKQRVLIEDIFRDSPNHRVLIGNITVIGKGMSFQAFRPEDDRLTIISPSYHMLDISQCAYRTNRAGKKGDASVYIFYGQGAGIEMETKIFDAMVRKTGVVKGTLDDNGNELRLPGEYESYHEPLQN